MNKLSGLVLALILFTVSFGFAKDPKALVAEMVDAIGGKEKFYSLQDVEYEYTYNSIKEGKKDVSLERYAFDGERSWAKFIQHEKNVYPQLEGEIIQGFNGSESWVTLNGKFLTEPMQLKIADFLRKTNYYWFAMMFKLLDDGINYEGLGTRNVSDIDYDVVKITFGENTGDVQDSYVLYINPETKLVDQFLFTVLDFGLEEPHLMLVEYEEIDGVKLPTYRKYAPANWDGSIKEEVWAEEISKNVKFKNGFDWKMFEKPEMEAMTEK